MKTKFFNALSLAVIMAMLFTSLALASDVDVAVVDVTVPTNSVTLVPGASGNITINMSVTGNQVGTATFEVYRDWTLSGGVFSGSNPQEFTVGPRTGGDPATNFSTSGTVTVAAGQVAGTFTLAVGAFDITNTNATGAKLAAGDPSNYQVTVSAPSDTTPPTITINTPVDGATYLLNQAVVADYFCEDEVGGSGLASCVGTVADGAAIDTSTVGSHSFTVDAADNAGNTNSASASYSVIYNWNGFFQPVDNLMLNGAKAGQAIPLKWRLTDANGAPVLNLANVTVSVQSLSCSLGTTTDAIEEYAAGASGLQNLGDGYYQFNWKTPTSYASSCKTMSLKLGDGVAHTAQFQFKK